MMTLGLISTATSLIGLGLALYSLNKKEPHTALSIISIILMSISMVLWWVTIINMYKPVVMSAEEMEQMLYKVWRKPYINK